MLSCLGIYFENNIIKYAKVSKDKDNVKIESFGIKFCDNITIDEAIKQIVSETYSYKTPISTNLSNEGYNYTQLFSLLNKKDMNKAIDTEFEIFCNDNTKNKKAIEYKTIITKDLDDTDKVKVLYVYAEKSEIVSKLQTFVGYTVNHITPLPITITNLNQFKNKKNSIIVNIEKSTSITTIINGEIVKVNIIDTGMKDILDTISAKENSYAKAYEICKNTTIYTTEGKNLQTEENEYIQDIIPRLYNVIQNVQRVIQENGININNIYITGLASSINNIDLYFQENFSDKKCEILIPYFVERTNLKLNVKDYIEVNSATALALQGIGQGSTNIDFKNKGGFSKLTGILNTNISNSKSTTSNNFFKKFLVNDFGTPLDKIEKILLRLGIGVLTLLIVYISFAKVTIGMINEKQNDIKFVSQDIQSKVTEITNYNIKTQTRIGEYERLITKMEQSSEKATQQYASKNAIPNFLNSIMFAIPEEVQLTSITNSSGKHIVINAQAKKYEYLGYFKAKIKTDAILLNVISTSGTKQNETVSVTIEGDLPY